MGTVQHVSKTYIHWNLFETVISTFTFVILFMNQTSDYHSNIFNIYYAHDNMTIMQN